MPAQYTVSAAAALLSVSVSTIRRICADMADILPDYQPTPGEARRLSEADVRTISAILTRLQASPGLTRSALASELSAPGSPPLIIPETLPTRQAPSPPDSPRAPLDVQAISDSPTQFPAALQALSTIAADVARLHARMDGLQSQPAPASPPDRPERVIAAALIALGVIFATVIVAALVWPSAGLVGLVIVAAVLTWGIAPLRTRG